MQESKVFLVTMRNKCVNVMDWCHNDLNEIREIWNTEKSYFSSTDKVALAPKHLELVISVVSEMLFVFSARKM